MEILVIILVLAVTLGGIIWGVLAARKRREELAALAARLGLSFEAAENRQLAERYAFLEKLDQGSNRYAFNLLRGNYQGHDVLAFDYHYETYSSNSKGQRQTHHHYFSFFILRLPRVFPELTIAREGWGSKLAQAFGYDDIDFESAEFSRTFCVRSPNKRFAYDFCHPQMMEYLLANPDLTLEVEEDALALGFGTRLSSGEIEFNLDRLVRIRSLLPDYVLNPAP
jgi:hypothetical protein